MKDYSINRACIIVVIKRQASTTTLHTAILSIRSRTYRTSLVLSKHERSLSPPPCAERSRINTSPKRQTLRAISLIQQGGGKITPSGAKLITGTYLYSTITFTIPSSSPTLTQWTIKSQVSSFHKFLRREQTWLSNDAALSKEKYTLQLLAPKYPGT